MIGWNPDREPDYPTAPLTSWYDRHVGWVALGSAVAFVLCVALLGRGW